jgi:pimeloyl-ACP methyl ester carboxylesterase
VTVDLPITDPAAGASEYADAIVAAAEGLSSVVLVGHSMSGSALPVAAHRLPTAHLCFVCAVLPVPGRSIAEEFAADADLASEAQAAYRFDELSRFYMDPADAKRVFFHDCDDDLAEWAVGRLLPQASKVAVETTPLLEWPRVPCTYVLCTGDRSMPPQWARRVVPERLGVAPVELPGGHAPYLSRPAQLADIIVRITRNATGHAAR